MSGTILVRDVMTSPVKAVGVGESVIEAVKKMNKYKISSVVVIGRKRLVGMITERDIMERIVEPFMDPRIVKAKDIMSKPVVTISPDVTIEEASTLMVKNRIKKLPVVKDGRLLGIVSATDLIRAVPKLTDLREELLRIRKQPL